MMELINFHVFVRTETDGNKATIAEAVLEVDSGLHATKYVGSRSAVLHPNDRYRQDLGEKLAASRAILDAALQLYDHTMNQVNQESKGRWGVTVTWSSPEEG